MEGDIKAFDTSYWDFFRKASQVQLIPTLQRPYTWDRAMVNQLWVDIIESELPYYIGSIVAIGSNGTTQRDEILDGQQRLTTISLFLISIRNYISDKKALDDVRKDIQWLLSEPVHDEPSRPRLKFMNSNSDSFYCSLLTGGEVQAETNYQKVFTDNIGEITNALKKYSPTCKPSEIKALLDKIKSLQIVFIRCQDRGAAYKLFESINARSVSLASTDLIKNRIFSEMYSQGGGQLSTAENKWQEIETIFNENTAELKTFIRHHWISLGRYTSHTKLFKDFEDYLAEEEGSAMEYLDSLVAASKVYVALRNANLDTLDKLTYVRFEREEIRKSLEFLSFLGVDQVYSVLLYLYQNEPSSFRKDLNRLVAFQFLYKYVPGSPSEPEKKYYAGLPAKAITKEKMFQGLLSLSMGQSEAFTSKLTKSIKYREGKSGDIQFALEKYLFSLAGPRAFRQPTIEHIIAQNFSVTELEQLGVTKKKMQEAMHSLGNLTILEKAENGGEYGDKPFSEKALLYKEDPYKGNQDICTYPFLPEPVTAIDKRGHDLAAKIYTIFILALEKGKWVETNQAHIEP